MQTAPDEASEYNYKEDSVSSSLAGLYHSLLVQTLTFSKFMMAEKKCGKKGSLVSIIKVQRSCLTTRLLLCFSISNRSRLCWVSLHRGESAYRQLCGRRRQDLLLL